MGRTEDLVEHVSAMFALEGAKLRAEMQAGLSDFQRGLRVTGAAYRPLLPNAVIYNGSRRLVGWSVRAVGGAATVTFHDGRNADADAIATFALAADGSSDTHWFGPAGVSFVEALYVEVTGTVTGAVWTGAVDL